LAPIQQLREARIAGDTVLQFLNHWKSPLSKGDWWNEAFTSEERLLIEEAYKPLGQQTAETVVRSDCPFQMGYLFGHLKKEHTRKLGYKLIERADSLIIDDAPVLSLHFYWKHRGDFYYRWRNLDNFALDSAVESYKRQIQIASKAIEEFVKEDWGFLPKHGGYDQLRIIEEKRGNLSLALELCEKASSEGWAGNWENQVSRINKKLSKMVTQI
jgi:hypothetical protein